ncbi:putative UDP-Gal or UDP-GlcNAc-dependent glycosyltransferase, partial [Trypanosoma cruzi]
MYCLIVCWIPIRALCTLWPNNLGCVIDRPVPPRGVPLPALDPRAGGGGRASGRPLRYAAGVLLLGACGEDVRVWVGPSMEDVCEFVFFYTFNSVIFAIGRWTDSAFSVVLCVCVACFVFSTPEPSTRGEWLRFGAAGDVFSSVCDVLVNGASHGATAVGASGVA